MKLEIDMYIWTTMTLKKEGKIYGLITIALAVFCVIYGGMGLIGLMNALGVM